MLSRHPRRFHGSFRGDLDHIQQARFKPNWVPRKGKGAGMDFTVLLQKLIAIERSIGNANNTTVRSLICDAQDFLIQMQKERAEEFLAMAWRDALLQSDQLRRAS